MPNPAADKELTDLEHLRIVTRKLLRCMEGALDDTSNEITPVRKAWHECLYGAKSTLASTLFTLAELVLKLEEQEPQKMEKGAGTPETISDLDAQMLEDFIQRARELHG